MGGATIVFVLKLDIESCANHRGRHVNFVPRAREHVQIFEAANQFFLEFGVVVQSIEVICQA